MMEDGDTFTLRTEYDTKYTLLAGLQVVYGEKAKRASKKKIKLDGVIKVLTGTGEPYYEIKFGSRHDDEPYNVVYTNEEARKSVGSGISRDSQNSPRQARFFRCLRFHAREYYDSVMSSIAAMTRWI